MREPDTQAMIDWLQQMLNECEVSILYYHNNPDKDKSMQRRRGYATDMAHIRKRLVYWQELLVQEQQRKL